MLGSILDFIDIFFNSNFVAVVVGGFLAGYFGFKQYKKQKNLESIDKKYFENFEELIRYLGEIREKLEHNYSTCLMIARYFRDLKENDFIVWLEKESSYEFSLFSSKMPASFFVVNYLLNDNKFKLDIEKLFAKFQFVNDYFVSDFIFCVKRFDKAKKNDSTLTKSDYYEKLVDEANKNNQESIVIYYAIGYLEKILLEIRKMNIDNFDKIENVKNSKKIKNILLEFNEKLETLEMQESSNKHKQTVKY
ncbi:MAG: hypothetical protein ACOCUF_00915 [Patescibacteria group bacterium]